MIELQLQANRIHDPNSGMFGDCHRTCMAMVLGVQRDTIPNFGEHFADMDKWMALEKAFCSAMGLFPIHIAYNSEGDWGVPERVIYHIHNYVAPGAPFILGGFSPGGTNHSVAIREDGVMLDPQGRDTPLVGPCDDGHWWVYLYGALPGALAAPDRKTWEHAL